MVNEKPNKQPLPQLAPGAPQPGPTLLQPSLPSLPLACAVALLHLPSPCASTSLTAQPAPWLAHWSFLHRIANKPSPSFLLLLSSRAFLPIFSCLDLTFPPLLTSVLAISRSAPPTGPAGCSRLEHEGPGPAHLRSPHHTLGPVAGCSGLLQVEGFSCQPEAPRYAMAGALMQPSWADRRWKDASGQEVNWAA